MPFLYHAKNNKPRIQTVQDLNGMKMNRNFEPFKELTVTGFPRQQNWVYAYRMLKMVLGVKVLDADKDSPAEKAGLQKDDIVTEIGGCERTTLTTPGATTWKCGKSNLPSRQNAMEIKLWYPGKIKDSWFMFHRKQPRKSPTGYLNFLTIHHWTIHYWLTFAPWIQQTNTKGGNRFWSTCPTDDLQ